MVLPSRRTARRRPSDQRFVLTVGLLCLIAVGSLAVDGLVRMRPAGQHALRLLKPDEECRLAKHAEDQCAFIKANCPDEEAGILSYLSLYYCTLSNAKVVAFVLLVLWAGVLFATIGIAASDFFCINLSTIATLLGMSENLAGVTLLAFGNGSPDVFSTFAAMGSHSGSLAIGELVGAALFISCGVVGAMTMVREFKVAKRSFIRDVTFFALAVAFTIVFLSDGALHIWESCVMIAFYVFYVLFVVGWHWYLTRRNRRRERDAAARDHVNAPGNEEIEVAEENDDEDEGASLISRRAEDWGALERGSSPNPRRRGRELRSDTEEGRQLHTAVEMASSMRVSRPREFRRNTITPIRPSLIGALEFRSVLSTLAKTRTTNTYPIRLERYSDDEDPSGNRLEPPASITRGRSTDQVPLLITISSEEDDGTEQPQAPSSKRSRAASMNDVENKRSTAPAAFLGAKVPDLVDMGQKAAFSQHLPVGLVSPAISISPPPSEHQSAADTWGFPEITEGAGAELDRPRDSRPLSPKTTDTPIADQEHYAIPPNESLNVPSPLPRLKIPRSPNTDDVQTSSPILPFPAYTESPMAMSAQSSRPPSIRILDTAYPPSLHNSSLPSDSQEFERPISWWPYSVLPSPQILAATLFPQLYTFRGKSIWDKLLGIISAPSILLLTITLPVVETQPEDEDEQSLLDDQDGAPRKRGSTLVHLPTDSDLEDENSDQAEWLRYRRSSYSSVRPLSGSPTPSRSRSPYPAGVTGHGNTAEAAVAAENHHNHSHPVPEPTPTHCEPPGAALELPASPRDWNRWLVIIQIFTAPLFVVFILRVYEWVDTEFWLLVLYALIASFVLLSLLLLTTTASEPPKYRSILCFIGFIVSCCWISIIANEVVGVLKAFGVIIGISDAILGLTVFAVGNSMGDLVADITVARLGYPVMALSACFGGPMLNILMGIGMGGLVQLIRSANHKHSKHPSRPINYKPYQVEVSGTLMVSAITLLVTLVALLVVVPLNKWMMTRKIGFGLIALWIASVIANVVIECTGVLDKASG